MSSRKSCHLGRPSLVLSSGCALVSEPSPQGGWGAILIRVWLKQKQSEAQGITSFAQCHAYLLAAGGAWACTGLVQPLSSYSAIIVYCSHTTSLSLKCWHESVGARLCVHTCNCGGGCLRLEFSIAFHSKGGMFSQHWSHWSAGWTRRTPTRSAEPEPAFQQDPQVNCRCLKG